MIMMTDKKIETLKEVKPIEVNPLKSTKKPKVDLRKFIAEFEKEEPATLSIIKQFFDKK